PRAATPRIVAEWAQGIEDVWSGYSTDGRAYLQVIVQTRIDLVNTHPSSVSGYNRIEIMPMNWNPWNSPWYDPLDTLGGIGSQAGGIVFPCVWADTGRWAQNLTPEQVAHEAGHLMGLADYYYYRGSHGGRALPGWEGSIMASPWGGMPA